MLAVGASTIAVPGPEHGLHGAAELGPRVLGHIIDTDDSPVDLAEPVVAVACEGRVPGRRGQARFRGVVEAEVEDRVHHPRHRAGGAGTHAHEERIHGVPETPPHQALHPRHVLPDLGIQAVRPTAREVLVAGTGGDRERRRDREPQHRGHCGDVRGLAPDDEGKVRERQVVTMIEVEDVGHEDVIPFARGAARRL